MSGNNNPAFGSGPPTAEGRDGRQRGLEGGRHLGCGRPQSLSRAAVEDGPTGHAALIYVGGLPGELILPSSLVTARYVTSDRRGRISARPLSEYGFPDYGGCRQAT